MTEEKPKQAPENELVIERLMPNIYAAVRFACLLKQNRADKNEIDDLCQQVALLLIEDDYRRLRTFDSTRASLDTWLKTVVLHYVNRRIKARRPLESLAEIDIKFVDLSQEERLIEEERGKSLLAVIAKLTVRERQLFECLSEDDLSTDEIAIQMGIKTASVYRIKHKLIHKIQTLLHDD
jgi:RNA polymerase sigma factor (sigma-70 family)